jgi:quinol monooxygenase YgiN
MGVIRLSGTVTCAPHEIDIARAALPEHIRLSRAEPGCLSFEVTETAPGVFTVTESFSNRAAFDAHQTRTRDSNWWRQTGHMPREFTVTER